MMELKEVLKDVAGFIQFGSFAAFGAMANYMNAIQKGDKKFSVLSTITIVFVAFFVGNVIVSFLGTEHKYLGGILMLAGWSLEKILGLLEIVTDKWIKKLKAWL